LENSHDGWLSRELPKKEKCLHNICPENPKKSEKILKIIKKFP